MSARRIKHPSLLRASRAVIETLESRRLLAADVGLIANKPQLVFNDPIAAGASPGVNVTLTNTTASALTIGAGGVSLGGTDAARFSITADTLSTPGTLAAGQSMTITLAFTATTVGDIRTASLQIATSDPDVSASVPLRGLGTAGLGGTNEPSLQRIMDLYQIPISVGDSNPSDVYLDNPPVQPNDEVDMQELLKAGSGPVTLTPIADFGVASASVPQVRFGYYTPGNQFDRTELLTLMGSGNATQTVNPVISGLTSFDPGSSPFGIYAQFPSMYPTVVSTPGGTQAFSEDALNAAYDPVSPRKVRFYTYKTPDGTVVPNTYVMALEDYNAGYDTQDFVAIISNVKPCPMGPQIGFENLDGSPFSNRLVFNRIQVQPPAPEVANGLTNYQPPNNIVHDTSSIRLRNTGSSTLTISSLVLSNTTAWQLVNAPSTPTTLAPGGSLDLTIKFIAQSGGQINSTLTVNSNDPDQPASVVQLAGWWQNVSEGGDEPSLQTIINTFGYATKVTYAGQSLNNGGLVTRVGDEVLSPYWLMVDPTLPVSVRQLDEFHTQGNSATLKWFPQGQSGSVLFIADGDEGQSFLPHVNNATVGQVGTSYAAGTFTTSSAFGFKIDGESSVDSANVQEQPGGNYGHHVRFFVARDRSGKIIPNTYIMVMDYSGINYDYNDNVYLISNIKPVSPPSQPASLTATPSKSGTLLDWADNTEANLAGYNVYMSTSASGPWTKLNSSLLSSSTFTDNAQSSGTTTYYQVTAVDLNGNESSPATTSAVSSTDTTPPAAPSGLFASGSPSGITLNWSSNTESDLAGYLVYRSDAPSGTYTLLTPSPISATTYTDTAAPSGATSYYHVTAIDTSGNESAPASANAARASLGANGNWNDLAYDKTGVLHFVWYDTIAHNMKYATRSTAGVWSDVQTIDNSGDDVGGWLSLAIDSQNRPGVAYFDGSAGDLRYASLVNGSWQVQTVDSKGSVGLLPSMEFDSANHPVIAYYKKTTGDLRFASFNGSAWNIQSVATTDDVGRSASLAKQSNGLWAIAYENSTRGLLQYSYQNAGGSWSTMAVDTSTAGMSYISLAFDTSGRASISYQETGLGDLRFAVLKKGKWSSGTIASKGAVGMYSRLVFGADGMANIFYYSKQLNTLMEATGYLGNWSLTTLASDGGRFIAAALAPDGQITYSWLDTPTQVLNLASFS